MENISIPPFYVGQEVVAIYTSPRGEIIKGHDYTITSIYKNKCCGIWAVTVGVPTDRTRSPIQECRCGVLNHVGYGELPFGADRFSPKIEIKDFISMKQLAEQQLELIAAN